MIAMRPRRGRRLGALPLNYLLPNVLTVLGMCAGLSAVRFAYQGHFDVAVVFLLAALVCDALDGRIARLLDVTTEFGAQLDSLADIVNFGVAPALIVYTWSTHNLGGIGWVLALLFAIACGLRLARFNAALIAGEASPLAGNFFVGVPAPAGAGLAILPLLLDLATGPGMFGHPLIAGGQLLFAGLLMVSKIPTYSLKRFRIKHDQVLPLMLAVALFAALMISYAWWTLIGVGVAYIASIPFSMRAHRRARRELEAAANATESEPG